MDSELDNGSDAGPLMMTTDKAAKGLIINNNIFLTEQQYNTLVTVDANTVQCSVCRAPCKIEQYPEHIRREDHKRNMMQHPPLEKYDLSIVRKVHNNHHCGVCNVLFDPEGTDDHLATEPHQNNLLMAINKVIDISYDRDSCTGRDKDCYHFNAMLINNENFRENEISEDPDNNYLLEKTLDEEYENKFKDEQVLKVEEEVSERFSYVMAARKPKTLPKYMEVEVEGRRLKVLFNSWHMMLVMKPNRFYCMVCRSSGHVGLLPDHCTTVGHKSKLESCSVVVKYNHHLIRKVDERLYHCAHCNNLQLISDIDDHIECSHPIVRNRNITEDSVPINSMEKNARFIRNGKTVTKSTNTATNTSKTVTKPDNTVARPGSSVTKHGSTDTRSDNTVARPGSSVTKHGSTDTRSDNTVAKPGSSVTKHGSTDTRSDNTVARPGSSVTKHGSTDTRSDNTVARPHSSVTKHSSTDTRSDNTVARPGSSVTKHGSTDTRSDNTVARPGSSVTKHGSTDTRSDNTVARPGSSVTKHGSTDTRSDNTVARPHSSVTKHSSTDTRSDNTVARPGSSVTKHGSTDTRSDNTVARPGSSVTKHGSTDTRSDNTVARPHSSVTKHSSTDTRSDNTVARPGSSVTKHGSTDTRSDNTVARPGSSVTKHGSTDTRSDNTAARPGSSVTKHGSTDTRSDNTAARPHSSVTKHSSTDTRSDNTVARPGSSVTKHGSTDTRSDNTVARPHSSVTKHGSTDTRSDNTVARPGSSVTKHGSTDTRSDNTVARPGSSVTKHGSTDTTNIFGRVEREILELHIFSAKITLSTLSYNTLVYDDHHYCCVCELTVNTEDLSEHVRTVSHIEHMNLTPFMNEFGINLIRMMRKCLHCAVCNVVVEHSSIYKHVKEPVHLGYLHKAVNTQIETNIIGDRVEKPSTSKVTGVDNNNQFSVLNQILDEAENNLVLRNADTKNGNDTANIEGRVEAETDVNTDTLQEGIETEVDTDQEEFMYIEELVLKKKKLCYKISVIAYNALVAVGDGTRYCALCSVMVKSDLKKHVESRFHTDNIHKYQFLENYQKDLLRQIFHTYHCAHCNVTFTRRQIKAHLSWPTHLQRISCRKLEKSRKETGNAMKEMNLEYQMERLYTTEVAPQIKIGARYQFTGKPEGASHKHKLILCNGNALKISWHSWNSFIRSETGLKCCLCKMELSGEELTWHSTNADHLKKLEKNLLMEHLPALMRKVNDDTLNCVTCNTEVANEALTIMDHIEGKKHERNFKIVLESSGAGSYEDCDQEVLTIP